MKSKILNGLKTLKCGILNLRNFKYNEIGLKWKLFLSFSMFALIVLALLWVFQVVFLDDFYKSIKISQFKSAEQSIASQIDSQNLDGEINKIAQSNDVCVIVLDKDFYQIASADVLPDCIIHKLPSFGIYRLYTLALENNGEYFQRFVRDDIRNIVGITSGSTVIRPPTPAAPRDDALRESIILTKIVKNSKGEQMTIILNSTISPVSSTVKTIRTQLIIITLIMIAIGLLMAAIISKTISKPIIKINYAAKGLAKGNYGVNFAVKGYKEIIELSQTLNYAASELSKVEKLQRELIANISHDLRTPLTLIAGYGEVMRDLPGENTPENVQIIIDEARHLTALVNDTLDISKLQSGVMEKNIENFNLTKTIKDILKRYKKLVEQDGYIIDFKYDKEVFVNADYLKLSQVIYNLINNAINYTGKDKSVIVRQTAFESSVRVEIIDTGEGIKKEDIPYIWDRYYKIDKSHKRASVGSGLGLSIVKNILDMHGVNYGVESKEGQGSNFWFELNL